MQLCWMCVSTIKQSEAHFSDPKFVDVGWLLCFLHGPNGLGVHEKNEGRLLINETPLEPNRIHHHPIHAISPDNSRKFPPFRPFVQINWFVFARHKRSDTLVEGWKKITTNSALFLCATHNSVYHFAIEHKFSFAILMNLWITHPDNKWQIGIRRAFRVNQIVYVCYFIFTDKQTNKHVQLSPR